MVKRLVIRVLIHLPFFVGCLVVLGLCWFVMRAWDLVPQDWRDA